MYDFFSKFSFFLSFFNFLILKGFLSMISADFKNTRLSLVSSMNEPLHNELVVQKLGGNEVTRNKLRILNCILSSFSCSSLLWFSRDLLG